MAQKKKKKTVQPPNKTFKMTLEVEFSGPKKGAEKRLLDWLLSKDSGTMPDDFLAVRVARSEETEVSKGLATAHSNGKKAAEAERKRLQEEKKANREKSKKLKAKRKATKKASKKKAKER